MACLELKVESPTVIACSGTCEVALEFGDFKQFDQAAVQLEAPFGASLASTCSRPHFVALKGLWKAYYADPTLESGAGKLKEVLSWRLLYLTVEARLEGCKESMA